MQMQPVATKWLTIKDVIDMIGFGKSWIYQHIKDGTFPQPIKIFGTANRWTLEQILNWMETAPQSPETQNENT
jgi:prophage regulatory protein